MTIQECKKAAAVYAVDTYIKSGMLLGLGSGTTTFYAIEYLGQKLKRKDVENIRCVPTSTATERLMNQWEIPSIALDELDTLDLVIDGADQIDQSFNLIKGLGKALLREKLVAQCTRSYVIIVDETKAKTFERFLEGPLPVEIVKFGAEHTVRHLLSQPFLKSLGAKGSFRTNCCEPKDYEETDNGNFIVDITFDQPLSDLVCLSQILNSTVGIVEHGLFLNLNPILIVGYEHGDVKCFSPPSLS
ncbi:ribose-5-phosphate isomerase A-like [Hylaeus volcanicus]|uniref:ribose-5-phosphate isomerase A-like n=1 Tax=Hylaeus volcanicus TaxID=313075 RepID=UPI0023B789EE|nr:ribose-5-phosphate isomerase A-like [Hylaeus volcanicus]